VRLEILEERIHLRFQRRVALRDADEGALGVADHARETFVVAKSAKFETR